MGDRRRRCTAEVNRLHARSSIERRLVGFLSAGGALVCSVLCFGCAPSKPDVAAADLLLRIGVAESNAASNELGIGQLTKAITHEGFTQLSPDGRAVARLAESWASENSVYLRLKLRHNVVLHDGKNLDAQGAAEALAATVAIESNRSAYPALGDVRGAIPMGTSELLLELRAPSPRLPEDLTVLLDIPAGPYRVVKQSDSAVEFERFESYFQGTPAIQRVLIKTFDTPRTAWASLLRGELDMVYDVPADAVDFIRNENVDVVSIPRPYQYHLVFNFHRGPFKSSQVRKALNMAVNRTALIEKALYGGAEPSAGPLYPKYWAYDSMGPTYSFDAVAASSLMDAAGYRITQGDRTKPPARFRFTCLLPRDFPVWEKVALEVQKDLFNVGVDMQFHVVTLDEFSDRIRSGDFEAAFISMSSGPTPSRPYVWWRSARRFKGGNVFGYENEEAERQFEVLLRSTNEAAIRTASSKLQRVFYDDPPAIFIAWDKRARAISRRFRWPDDVDPMFFLWKWTVASSDTVAAAR